MKNIVVLGAGFGGIYTALHLLKNIAPAEQVTITLLNKANYFLFSPMLHEVATGGLNRSNIVQPIREILKHHKLNFLRCAVKKIDFEKKKITTEKTTLPYDYLVIALGAETDHFNIPGVKEYALPLKTLEDAVAIRNRILEVLESGNAMYRIKNKDPELNFAIIGAGPTGVELAGEVVEFIDQNLRTHYPDLRLQKRKIYLMQRDATILPTLNKRSRDQAYQKLEKAGVTIITRTAVTAITETTIELDHKQKIKVNASIWTSGVKPVSIKVKPKITNEKGYFPIEETLRVKGIKNVYAIGDNAFLVDKKTGKVVPALAQVAVRQAKIAAKNILHEIRKEPLESFIFKSSGTLVSVGKRFAVADIHGLRFKGFLAWWLWRTIYLTKLIGFKNKLQVAYEWTLSLFFPRDTTEIK